MFRYLEEFKYQLLSGVITTLIIAILGTLIGLLLALVIGTMAAFNEIDIDKKMPKVFKYPLVGICKFYISIFRGTPMLIQALVFFGCFALIFGGKSPIVQNPLPIGIIVISLNTTAYLGEIIRGAVVNLEKGQMEAARSIGMPVTTTMTKIILPQAVRNSIPAIGNELIINIKDSCVLNLISVLELYSVGKTMASKRFDYVTPYLIIAIIYYILTFTGTKILYFISRRTSVDYISKKKNRGDLNVSN